MLTNPPETSNNWPDLSYRHKPLWYFALKSSGNWLSFQVGNQLHFVLGSYSWDSFCSPPMCQMSVHISTMLIWQMHTDRHIYLNNFHQWINCHVVMKLYWLGCSTENLSFCIIPSIDILEMKTINLYLLFYVAVCPILVIIVLFFMSVYINSQAIRSWTNTGYLAKKLYKNR